MRTHSALVVVTLAGLAAGSAHAQSFVNSDFETGVVTPWLIDPLSNGQTVLQTVEAFDIDGDGPLLATFAARFQAGNVVVQTGHQSGVKVHQSVNLTAGVPYLVSFNWAASLSGTATTNTEGGVFTLVADGVLMRSENAGSTTTANQPRVGFLQDVFVPTSTGAHDLGVNITRPFTISATTGINQWVDNFGIAVVTAGACCFSNGSCQVLTSGLCTARGGAYQGDNITCAAAGCAVPATLVAPFVNTTVSGGSSSNLPIFNGAGRTYQAVIGASQLSGIPVGRTITGLSFRLANAQATWPLVDANFAQFDIQLSTSLFPPNDLSLTFANNVGPDAVMVRSGALVVPANAMTGGGAVNPFSFVISFTTPFVYNGGDLLITIRHGGNDTGTTRTLDAITSTGIGAGIVQQAITATTNVAATGIAAAFVVTQLSVGTAAPSCYADCDGIGGLTGNDFQCFLNAFVSSASYADCDGIGGLTGNDFQCFLDKFVAGCS